MIEILATSRENNKDTDRISVDVCGTIEVWKFWWLFGMIGRKVGENFRICQKPRSRSSLGKQADPVYQYFHRIEFIGKLAKLLKNIPAVSLESRWHKNK